MNEENSWRLNNTLANKMTIDLSQFDRGVYLVNVLGIVYNPKTKKILIGRRENDPHVKELEWSFPGGRLHQDKTVEETLRHEVKVKTEVNVRVKNILLARIPEENKQFLLLYYYCETTNGKAQAGEKFMEVNWINPNEYKRYFKTSVHPEIRRFLEKL